jgi:YD repeat-containing protein
VATYATGGALDVTYTRDLKGRITVAGSTVNTEDWQYYYDDLGRLIASDNLGDNTQDRVRNEPHATVIGLETLLTL